MSSVLDGQVGGDHYKKLGSYQPWQVFAKWMTPEELKGFMKGTVITYLQRETDKGGRESIEKAMHTIQLYLEVTKDMGEDEELPPNFFSECVSSGPTDDIVIKVREAFGSECPVSPISVIIDGPGK